MDCDTNDSVIASKDSNNRAIVSCCICFSDKKQVYFSVFHNELLVIMDDRFLKTVSDGTRDTWKLTMNPIVLGQQQDEDFIRKYAYMDTQTKVIQVHSTGNL